jgi:transposase-like protein
MRVFSIAKGFHRLTKNIALDLSQKELDRLRAITLWGETKDVGLVCRTFGIGRATLYRWINLYRWIKRFDPNDMSSIKDKIGRASCRERVSCIV